MQTINLLPPDQRPPEPTAPKLIVTLYVGVAVCFSLVVWGSWLSFEALPTLEREAGEIETELGRLSGDVAYYDKLVAENRRVGKQAKLVDDTRDNRVGWTRRLDTLWDVVDASRTTWVSSFAVEELAVKVEDKTSSRKRRTASKTIQVPQLTLQLRSSSFEPDPDVLEMAAGSVIGDFIRELSAQPSLVESFEVVPPTSWSLNDNDWPATRRLTVDWTLVLRARVPDAKGTK